MVVLDVIHLIPVEGARNQGLIDCLYATNKPILEAKHFEERSKPRQTSLLVTDDQQWLVESDRKNAAVE